MSRPRVPVTDDLWVVSDTHFGHANIVRYQNRPQDHETLMLALWRERVGEDEPVLHLGDVWFGKGSENWAGRVAALPGRKYLIPGNHDRDLRLLREAGFEVVEPFVHRGVAFTHRPISSQYPLWSGHEGPLQGAARARLLAGAPFEPDWTKGWTTNVHGHVHGSDHRASEGQLARGARYVNMSVEVRGYAPVRLGEALAG
jgi:calcineurin-like phosphoesterase family protein